MLATGGTMARPGAAPYHKAAVPPNALRLVTVRFDRADRIYFQRCAGCHGPMRQGGTGKPLTLAVTRKLGFDQLRHIIHNGTAEGMPSWGTSGELSPDEVALMARYLLEEPAPPPGFGMPEIRASWKLHVPVAERPVRQMSAFRLDGKLSVDIAGDGRLVFKDTAGSEAFAIDDAGRGAVRARVSASSRYLYTMDCDARITLFDLWMKTPQPVAEIRIGSEGRSMEASGGKDAKQLSLLTASNWPPQYVALDGSTLEPRVVHRFQDFGKVRVGCGEDDE
ncbi:MAG: cytochrome D1 domain-containing protein [Hyphomicrobiales bacterium]